MHLDNLEKQICEKLQTGLPITASPFSEIAAQLNTTEDTVLSKTKHLLETDMIRRLSAMINYKALGRASTLVTAQVPPEKLDKVASAINKIENVSHNYQRDHKYNLWFTLQGSSATEIKTTLQNLSADLNINFISLPVERFFKLNVNFQITKDTSQPKHQNNTPQHPIKLTNQQKTILKKIQQGITPVSNPFDFLCDNDLDITAVLETLKDLKNKGIIKRIAAVLNHHLLGYTTNAMLVCKIIDENKIIQTGQKLAACQQISHCYQRKTHPDFNYNIFAMIHTKNKEELNTLIKQITTTCKITDYQLLPTTAEFKKQPVKYRF